jgi:hypothetical protein
MLQNDLLPKPEKSHQYRAERRLDSHDTREPAAMMRLGGAVFANDTTSSPSRVVHAETLTKERLRVVDGERETDLEEDPAGALAPASSAGRCWPHRKRTGRMFHTRPTSHPYTCPPQA